MRRVQVESPYSSGTNPSIPGVVERNVRYLRACLRDCILRGETPYASHGLLTQDGVLRDDVPDERALGIQAGFVMRRAMERTIIYTDLGWSGGMRAGEADAKLLDATQYHPIEERQLGGEWSECRVQWCAEQSSSLGPHHGHQCSMWRTGDQ